MSHITECKVELTNEEALIAAIEYLGLESLGKKEFSLYSGQKATGLGVSLEGWSYPVVIDCENGKAWYDNYNGRWGQQEQLDKLVQEYSAQVLMQQAMAANMQMERIEEENGDLQLIATSFA